jgi:hypothetical protein
MSLTQLGILIDYTYILNKIGQNGLRKIKTIFTITTIGHNNTRKSLCAYKLMKGINST